MSQRVFFAFNEDFVDYVPDGLVFVLESILDTKCLHVVWLDSFIVLYALALFIQ